MNQDLLEELVILYLTEELSPREMETLENKIPKEVQRDFVDTLNFLAYSAPQIKVSKGMKARILEKIEREELDFVRQRFGNLSGT